MKLITLDNIKAYSKKIKIYIIDKVTNAITELKTSLAKSFSTNTLTVGEDANSSSTVLLNFKDTTKTTLSDYGIIASETEAIINNAGTDNQSLYIKGNSTITIDTGNTYKKTVTITFYNENYNTGEQNLNGTTITSGTKTATITTSDEKLIFSTTVQTYLISISYSYVGGYVNTLNSKGITTNELSADKVTSSVVNATDSLSAGTADLKTVKIADELNAPKATITNGTVATLSSTTATITNSTITNLKAGNTITSNNTKTVIYTMNSSYVSDTSIKPSSDETNTAANITVSGSNANLTRTDSIYDKNNDKIIIPITSSAKITVTGYYKVNCTVNGTSFTYTGTTSTSDTSSVTVTANSDVTIVCVGETYLTKIVVVYSSDIYNALEVKDNIVNINSLNMKGNVISDLYVTGDIYNKGNTNTPIPIFKKISQTDYDALTSKDEDTVYLIYEG